MQNTTVRDLAEVAGLSLATVDRVLNDRPNVSDKARTLVARAIKETGFVRNEAAASLARNRPYRFRFVMPERGGDYLDEVIARVGEVSGSARREMTLVDMVQVPTHDPHAIRAYLATLSSKDVDGIVMMAPESPQARDAVLRLEARGVRTIRFLSGGESGGDGEVVGADDRAAGATAARLTGSFLRGLSGSVMVVTETVRSPDTIQRRLGLDAVLRTDFPDLHALPSLETRGSLERAGAIVASAFSRRSDIVAVYIASSEARLPIEAIEGARNTDDLVIIAHERTPFTEAALRDGRLDVVIAQDPGHAVRSAVRILRAQIQNAPVIASQERIRNEILIRDNL